MTKNEGPHAVRRPREVERVVAGRPTQDGAGVKLVRVLTQDLQRRLDPFLMLDLFGSDRPGDYIAGFPDHPHRGFETVTYMLAGRMRHRDSAGNEGLLTSGGVQWMTAGRGVIHSEMPEQQDGLMEGFQLWVNLPASQKMCEPGYLDIPGAEIPEFTTEDRVRVRVIAGEVHGVGGAVIRDATQPVYADLHFDEPSAIAVPLPPGHNAFVFVYRGELLFGGERDRIAAPRMAILANDPQADGVLLAAEAPARAILVAGRPLNEPIAQYGPFVMNTRDELMQAVRDFQEGRLA